MSESLKPKPSLSDTQKMQVCWYCILVGGQFFISSSNETSVPFHRILVLK